MARRVLGTALVAMALTGRIALAADPVCGDVNGDSTVKTSDALLVLRKGVDQPVTLDCSAYDERFSQCQSDLEYFAAQKLDICAQAAATRTLRDECEANYGVCKENRTSCNESLTSLNADLAVCTEDLTACNDELEACESDVATAKAAIAYCEASPPGRIHKTGQTTCFLGVQGHEYACDYRFPDQDGYQQRGIANRFSDNGDGTITDERSGLMWEKLDDAGGIHDQDNVYTWDNIVVGKILPLKSANFAGYNDWRAPNRNELMTLVNIGTGRPATFSEFNAACAPGCSVTTCSCTSASGGYWSSTTHLIFPDFAWQVGLADGAAFSYAKTETAVVRAVRGGS